MWLNRFFRRAFRSLAGRFAAIISKPITASEWYRSRFIDYDRSRHPNNEWYRRNLIRNFNIVVLGSSGAKWAFDFGGQPIKGMNWAEQPQLMADDFNLLKNFHSILRKGATVVITLMPFSSLNKPGSVLQTFRYLRVFQNREWLLDYRFASAAYRLERFPIFFGVQALKAGLFHLLGIEHAQELPKGCNQNNNPLSSEELRADAEKWMRIWKRQFRIPDFEYPLTPENAYDRQCKIPLVRMMIDFCTERGYRPVIVIPPVSKYLAAHFTNKFQEIYIDSFLKELDRRVSVFNYLNEERWKDADLYFNSFFMNRRGRRLFTQCVLSDLGLLHGNG